jgi:hypothetical protein
VRPLNKTIHKLTATLGILLFPIVGTAADTGDLKIRFQYGGDAPKQGEVK